MAQYKESTTRTFINPYNFVHVDDKKIERLPAVTQKGLTGKIHCKLQTLTPLIIPDTARKTTKTFNNEEHAFYPFFSIGEDDQVQYAIPGSSIRGCIRSIYETLTNSCFVTARNSDPFSARDNTPNVQGLLIYEGNGWNLYEATRYMLLVQNKSAKFTDPLVYGQKYQVKNAMTYPSDGYLELDIGGNLRKCKSGDELFFDPVPGGKTYIHEQYNRRTGRNTTFNTQVPLVCQVVNSKGKNSLKGFLFVGEKFSNKHHESIFVKGKLIADCTKKKKQIDQAMKNLGDNIDIYRNTAINHEYEKSHWGYKEYEAAEKKGIIPVWYHQDKDKNFIYLSPAQLGRRVYRNSEADLLGDYQPCKEKTAACEACRLFGMIGNSENSVGSRIRFTDAVMKCDCPEDQIIKNVTLEPLGSPKPSYFKFYVDSSNGDLKEGFDSSKIKLKGRKYYWGRKIEIPISENKDVDRNSQNATFDVVKENNAFEFDVFFNDISDDELEKLCWSLTLGNNSGSDYCQKLGHGKPLGFGSVKITYEKVLERNYNHGVWFIATKEINADKIKKLSVSSKDLLLVSKLFDRDIGDKIHYPHVELEDTPMPAGRSRENMNTNIMGSMHWFVENKRKRDEEKSLPAINSDMKKLELKEIYVSELEPQKDFRNVLKANTHGNAKHVQKTTPFGDTELPVSHGTIKKFFPEKDFGFIDDTTNGRVFFHFSSFTQRVDKSELTKDRKVTYSLQKSEKGWKAVNLRLE